MGWLSDYFEAKGIDVDMTPPNRKPDELVELRRWIEERRDHYYADTAPTASDPTLDRWGQVYQAYAEDDMILEKIDAMLKERDAQA